MLRPATPLTALLGLAFALLLLSVLSAPIISAIPLGSFDDIRFGVFGFCQSSGCSSLGIGYDIGSVMPDRKNQAFDLPNGVRHTLSSILILHPVAAFLTLVLLFMAIAAHLRAASHSSRYLLFFFMFNFITLLVCIAAFVIDVLLFVPHMAWGTYIVLAGTILVFLSALVSCAMRRTLVSRKDRKRRIAENAEMSGENYYNRENLAPKTSFTLTTQPTMPVISGGNGTQDNFNLPAFATYEAPRDDQRSEERIPLTQRAASERSSNGRQPVVADMATVSGSEISSAYGGPQRSATQDSYGHYGNMPPNVYGAAGQPYDGRRIPTRRETDPVNGYGAGRGGYGAPMRGRGGYGSPSRGGYGPRGGRGGYGPSSRAGYGGGPYYSGGGGRSQPPMNYSSDDMGGQYNRRQQPPRQGFADGRGGPYAGAQQPPQSDAAVNYGAPSRAASNSGSNNSSNRYMPYRPDLDLPRAESPPPLPEATESASSPAGQAIEMDATPAAGASDSNNGQYGNLRDSDTDVAGMVNLQQGQQPSSARRETFASDGSKYSEDVQYIPSGAQWHQETRRNSPLVAPVANMQRDPTPDHSRSPAPAASAKEKGNYYEDVDPRFDQTPHTPPRRQTTPPPPLHLQPVGYEDIRGGPDGTRSPAESEHSNFTSISQRGINPQWSPQPPMPQRRPVQERRDMILDNPDFRLPGSRSTAAGKRRLPGMIPESAYPNRPM